MTALIVRFLLANWLKVVIVAGCVAAAGYIYKQGYDHAANKYLRLMAAEKARIEKINNSELGAAEIRIAKLREENDKLEKELADAAAQAQSDPDAGRAALGPRSVQRLNRIR